MGTCKNCKFWEPITDEPELAQNNAVERGRCHEKSPNVTPILIPKLNALRQMVPEVVEFTVWPITIDIGWCGKFEGKTTPAEPIEIPESVRGTLT